MIAQHAARRLKRAEALVKTLPVEKQELFTNAIGPLSNVTESEFIFSAAVNTKLNDDGTTLDFQMTQGHIPKPIEDMYLLHAARIFSDVLAATVRYFH